MKSLIFAFLFSGFSISMKAAVLSVDCLPDFGTLASDGASYGSLSCNIRTDDAGVFVINISSQTTPIRANAQGDIRAADLPGIKTRIQLIYRATIAARRSGRASILAEVAKRERAYFKMTSVEVE